MAAGRRVCDLCALTDSLKALDEQEVLEESDAYSEKTACGLKQFAIWYQYIVPSPLLFSGHPASSSSAVLYPRMHPSSFMEMEPAL
jgi:hypothetical protein